MEKKLMVVVIGCSDKEQQTLFAIPEIQVVTKGNYLSLGVGPDIFIVNTTGLDPQLVRIKERHALMLRVRALVHLDPRYTELAIENVGETKIIHLPKNAFHDHTDVEKFQNDGWDLKAVIDTVKGMLGIE